MKRTLALYLVIVFLSWIIGLSNAEAEIETDHYEFASLDDPDFLRYIEREVYDSVVEELGSDEFFVENVSAVYISNEYLEEMVYNSQANIYFGYTLAELNNQFEGKRYVFALGENNETIVKEFEVYQEDETWNTVLKNVAIGAGVILICVTVSVATAGAAPAVSVIFAASAKTATTFAASGAVFSGVTSGAVKAILTGDVEESMKAAALSASEGFKWGAISGALVGGVGETFALKGATMNGLTMNEAAFIQQETHLPLEFIKNLHSMDEFDLYQDIGLEALDLDGILVYGQTVDLSFIDDAGLTNAERIMRGYSPLDPDGIPYELHHIGQSPDSPLAILTREEHRLGDNYGILHFKSGPTEIDREVFAEEREQVWMAYLENAA